MPHNRTRIWVGLAIAGITIPAVGEYYSRTTTPELLGSSLSRSARLPMDDGAVLASYQSPVASTSRRRDYAAELDAVLARQQPRIPIAGSEDDPTFDISPYDDGGDNSSEDATDSTSGMVDAPDSSSIVADAQNGTLADSNGASPPSDPLVASTPFDPNGNEDSIQMATDDLSDATVYGIVVNNLPPDQRDEFARAYAAMGQGQRSDLLAGFRDQIQSGTGQ